MLGRNSSHFWGVVLDTPDPMALAEFYAALMDWKIVKEEPDFVAVAPLGDHVEYLAFQRSPDYEQPAWPNKAHKQQMMMHLDIEVPDLETAVRSAREAGATEADHQPQDTVRVMLDPDGHPFCLYVDTSVS
ncbi:glyoxalase [Actinoplanes sp. NBRC 14428]|uniref:Glyoxalase/bleomycin resistance protein/dioxygenase superfamily protein n=1 Tax=Pseudosporangium ferrugineum TaxID=439699 RepID=A0A2T0S4V2_9ACTN|nr:VOC family protein [Pseudosporangium ferrugineum]PRY28432.1 glyoxalase/bleomycin resistance protein/dioxygenase superfamily protein [Pseudosporangium ferrugineum]BCJ53933.1 glyoxalase [Actinoplanes sp. NBRC 14428]